jgi:hypothetical protein
VLNLSGYPDRVRLMVPADLGLSDGLEHSLAGFRLEDAPTSYTSLRKFLDASLGWPVDTYARAPYIVETLDSAHP